MSSGMPPPSGADSLHQRRAEGIWRVILRMRDAGADDRFIQSWLYDHRNISRGDSYTLLNQLDKSQALARRLAERGDNAKPLAKEMVAPPRNPGSVGWWFRVSYRDETGELRYMRMRVDTGLGTTLGEARADLLRRFRATMEARRRRGERRYQFQGELVIEDDGVTLELVERLPP